MSIFNVANSFTSQKIWDTMFEPKTRLQQDKTDYNYIQNKLTKKKHTAIKTRHSLVKQEAQAQIHRYLAEYIKKGKNVATANLKS